MTFLVTFLAIFSAESLFAQFHRLAMALSKDDQILIKVLRQEKGDNALRFQRFSKEN
jgi:hypothetical protein